VEDVQVTVIGQQLIHRGFKLMGLRDVGLVWLAVQPGVF
jgi:hypothetical protein